MSFSPTCTSTPASSPTSGGRRRGHLRDGDRPQAGPQGRHIRNIRFENIDCCGENGVFLHGSADNYLEDISLRGVRIHMKKQTRWPLHQWDLRPCEGTGLIPGAPHGVTCVYGRGIRCEDVRVTHDET